jgi:pimeloyl-ACP methyl ester carboxylesterase
MNLEVLSKKTETSSTKPPLLFVHGAYVGAWCWEEHFLDWFAQHGYDAHAVSLRGHGGSAGRDQLDEFSLGDYAQDVARVASELPRPPVLIGHSMGALVVQKVLEGAEAPAAVLACPVPSFGLLVSSFTLAFTRPALFAGLNAVATGGRASREALGEAFFGGTPPPAMLDRCFRRVQRESRRALMDMSGWGLPSPWRAKRPPTLVLGAEKDALIPASQAQATAGLLGAEYRLLPALGHAIMMDVGWESAAREILGWLEEREF